MAFEKQEKILGVMSKICDEALALRCKGRTDAVWGDAVSEQMSRTLFREPLLLCRDDERYFLGIEGSWFLFLPAELIQQKQEPTVKSMPENIEKISCAGVSFELIILVDRDERSPLEYYRINLAA